MLFRDYYLIKIICMLPFGFIYIAMLLEPAGQDWKFTFILAEPEPGLVLTQSSRFRSKLAGSDPNWPCSKWSHLHLF